MALKKSIPGPTPSRDIEGPSSIYRACWVSKGNSLLSVIASVVVEGQGPALVVHLAKLLRFSEELQCAAELLRLEEVY